MIYTVGVKQSYLKAIEREGNIKKAIGGSVWKTYQEAFFYSELSTLQNGKIYDVFGVDADWDKDTVPDGYRQWNKLIIDAPIIILTGRENDK